MPCKTHSFDLRRAGVRLLQYGGAGQRRDRHDLRRLQSRAGKLAPEYEAQSGDKIILVSGPSMGKTPQAIPARLARGASRCADHGGRRSPNWKRALDPAGFARGAGRFADRHGGQTGRAQAGDKTDADLRNVLLQADSFAYSDSASVRYVSGQLFKSWASRNR